MSQLFMDREDNFNLYQMFLQGLEFLISCKIHNFVARTENSLSQATSGTINKYGCDSKPMIPIIMHIVMPVGPALVCLLLMHLGCCSCISVPAVPFVYAYVLFFMHKCVCWLYISVSAGAAIVCLLAVY